MNEVTPSWNNPASQTLPYNPYQQNPNLWAARNPYNYPVYAYQAQPQPAQNQQLSSNRVWVQGEGSAKAYIVANNSEQVLWDSDNPSIYIKTVDQNGKPSITILDYTIRETSQEIEPGKDMDDLKKEISELKDMVKGLAQNKVSYNKPVYNKKGGED